MCGIFAMFLKRPLLPEDIAGARSALTAIAHRGPDGSGEWFDEAEGVYLGHRRLSIIDLSEASAQPICRGAGILAFNGELYNFKELRKELETEGFGFVSQGDGEVFLRGLQRWGRGMFDRADGMFALTYWDGAIATVAVDAFGEKPLFVAQTADGVYLCSEIAPLANLLGCVPRMDEEDWVAYLGLGFIPQPRTVYPGIEMMPPGSWREIRQGRAGLICRYWRPPPPQVGRGRVEPVTEKALEELIGALVESLAARLLADVPLTLFLSAGTDSALIAALCRRELDHEIDCLTVSFPAAGIPDESPVAGKIASHLGYEHRVLPSDMSSGPERLPELLGQPSGTVGVLPLEQISAQARKSGYKVAVTGMGGDEVTAGYGKHAYLWRLRHFFSMPRAMRAAMARLLRVGPASWANFAEMAAARPEEVYLAIKNYPALSWLRELPGFAPWAEREFDHDLPPEIAVPRYELEKVMPAVHLYTSDHASMRHGLELRTPFLNRRVLETVAGWDARALVAFGQKSILRRILRRYLPETLTCQPKTGFTYPRDRLLHGNAPRGLAGLDDRAAGECWARRGEGGGWAAIAVRLRCAEIFLSTRPDIPVCGTGREC